MDFAMIFEIVKIPATVLVTDTAMWLNWALTDGSISSYEWKILVSRLIKFGLAGGLLAFVGLDWNVAAGTAGLLTFGDAWIKSLRADKKEESTITTL